MYTWGEDWTGVRASQVNRHSILTCIPIPGPTLSVAGGGGGSNTTHALLSPDPETLPMGEVSRPATGEFQGQPTVAPYAPLTAGPNSPLSQRYGPAIITQELVAENGLFQPKLKLTQKSPKSTPRPDTPEVGTRQLTLCPSSTNYLEPSPNLVPSEVPASGHHGFVTWGHDCQNGKIGRLGRPSRVGNLGDIDAPSLDSQPLMSPLVACPGLSLAVTPVAYCSPRG